MTLSDMKAFMRFLDEASQEELRSRKRALEELLASGDLTNKPVVHSARRLLRLIDEELVSRAGLQSRSSTG